MKKTALLLICFVLTGFGLQKPGNDLPPPNPYAPIKDIEQGHQAYKRFHTAKPNYKLDTTQLKQRFPQLFLDVPLGLHDAIARYIPLKYPIAEELVASLENSIYSPFARRLLTWTALGYEFGVMPYYNYDQGYFYFEQPRDDSLGISVLKGMRKDYRLEVLRELDNELSELQKENKKPELTQQAQKTRQQLVEGLSKEYKIHLMPTGEATATIVKLLQALKADKELQTLIAAFKVIAVDSFINNKGKTLARIVVYPAAGKENAQKALNKLYAVLKDIPGLDIKPRYNAKVTDLIWIAQGDSHTKNTRGYIPYFEDPKRVYYRKDLTGTDADYHLVHPETGKEIV